MRGPVVTMPGKLGDLLMAIPAMREVRRLYKRPLTLVTTPYCYPALGVMLKRTGDLFDDVRVYDQYVPTADAPGLQPWKLPIPSDLTDPHRDVFQLGFRGFPLMDETIPEFLARQYQMTVKPGPWLDAVTPNADGPILMHAPGLPLARAMLDLILGRRTNEEKGRGALLIGTRAEVAWYHEQQWEHRPGVTIQAVEDLDDVWRLCSTVSRFVGVASAPAVVAAASGLPCSWMIQAGGDERCVPKGLDITVLDQPRRDR